MQHAFLITAYNNFDNLQRLLAVLDDERCDIFLHIDSKAGMIASDSFNMVKKARLHFIPAMNVSWGDVSQITCTLRLIRYALEWEWDYCHYITESDMPLKTVDGIDEVISKYCGSEFVDYEPGNYEFAHYKCEVYHLFPRFSAYRNSKILKALNHGFAKLQWYIGIRRYRKEYKHGSAYFSVSRSVAVFLDRQADEICREYRNTIGADEVWLQTLLYQSPFKNNIFNFEKRYLGNLRYIDWSRRLGNSPYTFQNKDYEDLVDKAANSDLLFARKFSRDSGIAEQIRNFLEKGEGRREKE